MAQVQRIEMILRILSVIDDQPKTMSEIARIVGCTASQSVYITNKLKSFGLVQTENGVTRTGMPYDEDTIKSLFNYTTLNRVVTVQCNVCNVDKPRICISLNNNKPIYTDKSNRRWEGKRCPECVSASRRVLIEEPKTSRKCRGCGVFLTVSRYFKCIECQPSVSIDDDFIYIGESRAEFDDFDIYDLGEEGGL